MKLILRILICTLGITTAQLVQANGASQPASETFLFDSGEPEFTTPVEIKPAATAPVIKTETLDREYIKLTLATPNLVTVSVLNTFKNFTEAVQKKYYSLLDWTLHQRLEDLEIANYSRAAQFGRWINDPTDETCFNTRAKVLVRDSVKSVVFKDHNHCVVQNGNWKDPYTKSTIKESSEIQIDHFVPLKNAYISGAYKWNFRERCLYANYMGTEFHLLSVNGIENMRKGDRSPAAYMPPNTEYSCTYVRNWLAVKMQWGLTMSTAEANAINKIISDRNCSLSKFRVSEKEIISQRQFAKDNIDLCEKIDKSALLQ